MVTVDQACVGEVTGEGGAAVDDDRPALGLLERGDVVERAENGGLAPVVTTSLSVRVVATTCFGNVF